MVVYYRENNELKHKNFVFVIDDLGHNIGVVYAIMKRLVPEISNAINCDLKKIHYWTDGPTSQYRNKTAFYLVATHNDLFGVDAEWNYFEAGHGKGPCDGIGGTAKRMADLSIKQEKVKIQDASDFHTWGKYHHKSATYVFVTGQECSTARGELDEVNKTLIPDKGTLQIHNVSSTSKDTVCTRITSCYCSACLGGELHSDFSVSKIRKCTQAPTTKQNTNEEPVNQNDNVEATPVEESPGESMAFDQNDWVVALYDNKWYPGNILEVDEDDQSCLISFLRRTTGMGRVNPQFQWPSPLDKVWVDFSEIFLKINEPQPVGRSRRFYELQKFELTNVNEKMKLICKK